MIPKNATCGPILDSIEEGGKDLVKDIIETIDKNGNGL